MKTLFTSLLVLITVTFSIAGNPYLDAGPDQYILAGEAAPLNGKAFGVKHFAWKSNGTGTFANKYLLRTTYKPSKTDIKKGFVKLTLYSRSNPRILDSMFLYIRKCPGLSLTPSEDTVCGSDDGVIYYLNASAQGSGYYAQWTTGGSGYFSDEYSLNTIYEASSGDVGSGSVVLKITIYDSTGFCPAKSDSLLLKLNDPARIDLPDSDVYTCGNEPVFIDGNISGTAYTVNWTSTGTGYFSQSQGRDTYYYPSLKDIANGNVIITGITNDPPGPCFAGSDQVTIQFYGPAVNAGPDIIVCGYEWGGDFPLHTGTSGMVEEILWTTNGSGGFDDPTSFSPVYYYNETDVNNAGIELYVTVSGGGCPSYTDTVRVELHAAPKLEFPEPSVYQNGSDPVYASVYLYGYASGGTWNTSGSGSFADPHSTYTAYYPSEQDKINGCVELYFTSNDPEGPCGAVNGSMSACFNPPCPSVDAGADIIECGSAGGGMIYVSATGAGLAEYIEWTTNGAGSFEDPYAFSTYYYYDPSDVNQASIELYATVYNWSGCSHTDTLIVWLHASPDLVFPEPEISACTGETVYANVYLYGYASSGTWTGNGSGWFDDPSSTYTAYHPSAEDGTSGCVELRFTSNDPEGPCGKTSGTMNVCFYECGRKTAESITSASRIMLSPNPAINILEIKSDTEIYPRSSYVTGISGNKIPVQWTSSSTINVAELKPGTYFLHLASVQGIQIVRFTKE